MLERMFTEASRVVGKPSATIFHVPGLRDTMRICRELRPNARAATNSRYTACRFKATARRLQGYEEN